MNILVIKQTSLGDVLHAAGHLRAIKENFPDGRLTLLTAAASADIHRHNPWVDDLIELDLARIKRDWRRRPLATVGHLAQVLRAVRARRFDLAFDLQGLARSVVFLYAARASRKFVKGNWRGPRLARFRRPELHAIAEMDGVLRCAGLQVGDTSMEIFTAADAGPAGDELLADINPRGLPLLVFSAFSRWPAKDWPLRFYVELAARVGGGDGGDGDGDGDGDGGDDGNGDAQFMVAFTGAAAARARIDEALAAAANPATAATTAPVSTVNLAGRLSLPQFAELVRRARLVVSGDSFPMHLACAQKTPVVALFGPTFESKTGPVGAACEVIRAPDCAGCERRHCARRCLDNIPVDAVFAAVQAQLKTARGRLKTPG